MVLITDTFIVSGVILGIVVVCIGIAVSVALWCVRFCSKTSEGRTRGIVWSVSEHVEGLPIFVQTRGDGGDGQQLLYNVPEPNPDAPYIAENAIPPYAAATAWVGGPVR